MKIYIDNKDLNVVKIKAFSDMKQPANTTELVIGDEYDDLFSIMKRMIDGVRTTYYYKRIAPRKFKRIPVEIHDYELDVYKGQYLVYYKDSGKVDWNPVKPQLRLSTDAEDVVAPFDGMPDLKANGKSSCKIWANKYNSVGIPLTRGKDNDLVTFTVTRGSLSESSVRMVNGECYTTLTSSLENISRQVEVKAKMGDIEESLILQFAPSSAYV